MAGISPSAIMKLFASEFVHVVRRIMEGVIMQDERKRILDLVEKGTITAQEAIVLFEKLEQPTNMNQQPNENKVTTDSSKTAPQKEYFENESEKEKMASDQYGEQTTEQRQSGNEDEFFEEIRKDFTQFGTKLVNLMNTTFSKVKEFDFDKGFMSSSASEEKIEELQNATFSNISIDIPNGNIELIPTNEESAKIVYRIRPTIGKMSDDILKEFNQGVVSKADDDTLRIVSATKKLRLDATIYIPAKKYDFVTIRQFNGGFKTANIDIEQIKVKTMNGGIDFKNVGFYQLEAETANGAIDLRDVKGKKAEVETVNGRIYVDGKIEELDAKSANGHVVVTTRTEKAKNIRAQTIAGAVEIYIPNNTSLQGEVTSNLGKVDVRLPDIQRQNEQNQFLQKSVQFSKIIEDTQTLLVEGETKTGSVIVRYNL